MASIAYFVTRCRKFTHCAQGVTERRKTWSQLVQVMICHLFVAKLLPKPWASNQIHKIAYCACAGNTSNVFTATDFKGNLWSAIPPCIAERASRTCRDACRDRQPAVAGKTFPAFPAHAQPTILRIWQEAHCWLVVNWILSNKRQWNNSH